MFCQPTRDDQYLNRMKTVMSDVYGLEIKKIQAAKRGYYGETWKVETNKSIYFIKIDYIDFHKNIYRNSFHVMDFMWEHGIDFIPPIIKTRTGELFSEFDRGVMGVFGYIEGNHTEDYPPEKLFRKFVKIYQLHPVGLHIEEETFDVQILSKFTQLKEEIFTDNTVVSNYLNELLSRKKPLIDACSTRLEMFSVRCKNNRGHYVITHGDAYGNCIISDEVCTIVDWDYPKMISMIISMAGYLHS